MQFPADSTPLTVVRSLWLLRWLEPWALKGSSAGQLQGAGREENGEAPSPVLLPPVSHPPPSRLPSLSSGLLRCLETPPGLRVSAHLVPSYFLFHLSWWPRPSQPQSQSPGVARASAGLFRVLLGRRAMRLRRETEELGKGRRKVARSQPCPWATRGNGCVDPDPRPPAPESTSKARSEGGRGGGREFRGVWEGSGGDGGVVLSLD